MTQELYQKAMKFAGEKHCNQKVPGSDANYLLHISNVVMEVIMAYKFEPSFDLDLAIQIAALHDIIEDTETAFEEIQIEFGNSVAQAVQSLTKNDKLASKEEKMIDSLNRINQQPIEAGIVKIADRITNLQKPPAHWPSEKVLKYFHQAKLISKELSNKHNYLNVRLESKIKEYYNYV